jgi:hypothetical protein
MDDRTVTRDPSNRRRTLTHAAHSPHLEGLSLDELRAYRKQLSAEEDKASYWRRLVHARLDVLEARVQSGGGTLSMSQLVRVLGDTGAGRVRTALVAIHPAEPLPDLPALAETWITEIDPQDDDAIAEAMDRLRIAEAQLSDYRRALHQRIDEATGDLINRYREDPAQALSAMPD